MNRRKFGYFYHMKNTGNFLVIADFREYLHRIHLSYATALAEKDHAILCETSLHLAQVYNIWGNMELSVKWAEEYARCSGHSPFFPYWKKESSQLN